MLLPVLAVKGARALLRRMCPALARDMEFWSRVLPIYVQYKMTQQYTQRLVSDADRRDEIWTRKHAWGAKQVYNLCTSMRGFYLKDGQFIGSRADFVPAAWCDELCRLQDRVPPVPFRCIERTLCESFGVNTIQQIFSHVDQRALGSATIAQVHKAEWCGCAVVIKAQYADQEALCRLDLKNLRKLAEFLQSTDFQFFDLISVVCEFEQQIPLEFDFELEARHMHTIATNLARAEICPQLVCIPATVPGLVARRAIVMEYMDGVRITERDTLEQWGIDRLRVVEALGHAYGQMLLVDGLFHADCHEGNVFVLRDNRVALIDFGNVKSINQETRRALCAFYLAMANGDDERTGQLLFAMGIELKGDLNDPSLLSKAALYANGLFDTRPLPLGVEINPFSSRSPLRTAPIKRFPAELFMVLRTMGLLRAFCVQAGVRFAMSRAFEPYAMQGLSSTTTPTKFPTPSKAQRLASRLRRFSLSSP
ncbi:Uncharacterized protein FVE85_4285 [Porphyridium purpureum]|uniref:ABC1 atypical kinase-like domain-containing protein n=1 Tax=Porphyridium purpureum TaxID=35688 RepID=A0A5J4YTP8_PORPP|nr:Uncharacterized protein FVE85_4285 [Porphyridium purpureum]|eukprot:POR7102..scf229_5